MSNAPLYFNVAITLNSFNRERCPSWPKEHDWKSCMRQKRIWGSNPHLSARKNPWRGGRAVECGSLENCFTCKGDGGSNPPSSAIFTFLIAFLNRRFILPLLSLY